MLPKAVQEQADRAEAAHLALIAANTAQAAPVVQPAQVATPEPTEAAPVEPTAEAQAQSEQHVQATDSWEIRYKVLQGKYQAEVPRMAQQLRDAQEALRLAEQRVRAVPVEPAARNEELEAVSSQYGEDFAAAVATVAQAETKKVRDELGSQVQALAANDAEHARNAFLADLGRYIPNFAQIDADPGFTAYLNEIDTQSGRSRREFFTDADSTNNAARVASFFDGYLKSKSPVRPPAPQATAAPSVEHLIAPESSLRSEAPPGKKTWTKKEVQAFYAGARRGEYSPADYDRIDADITVAQSEGRYLG